MTPAENFEKKKLIFSFEDQSDDIGVEQEELGNFAAAELLYKISSSLINVMAMTRLAGIEWKKGSDENISKAIEIYKLAGELGDAVSYYNLSVLYGILGDEFSKVKYQKIAKDLGFSDQ